MSNKIFILAGLVLAGFLVFKINSGEIVASDVVRIMYGGTEISSDERGLLSKRASLEEARKVERGEKTVPEVEEIEDRDISILAFGDMMLGRHVRVLMDQYGKDYIFEDIYNDMSGRFFHEEKDDIVFANLEGPILGQGKKGGTSMNFSFNEDVGAFLKGYDFDVLSIANNHSLDQGWDGRDSTIEVLAGADIGWCGHPTEADPESVYYGELEDEKYAFVCFQDVSSRLDYEDAIDLVKWVSAKVDYLIVSIHWGLEYKFYPNELLQVSPGRELIDAGADFIIGHHPHVVQGFEEYRGKLIFYSLGNFVFDQYWSQMTQEELAIRIVLDDPDENDEDGESFHTKVYLYPMKSVYSKSQFLSDDEYASWAEEFIGLGDYSEETKSQIRKGFVEVGM